MWTLKQFIKSSGVNFAPTLTSARENIQEIQHVWCHYLLTGISDTMLAHTPYECLKSYIKHYWNHNGTKRIFLKFVWRKNWGVPFLVSWKFKNLELELELELMVGQFRPVNQLYSNTWLKASSGPDNLRCIWCETYFLKL